MTQVAILGLDGATFDLVRPWTEAGLLPNLAALMERGSDGPLRSTMPATTPLAWPSIYTGTNPGKHGIFGFHKREPNSYRWIKSSSLDVHEPAVWDLLAMGEVRSGIYFVPYTFPARPLNGAMVTGRGGPRKVESNISHPDSLAAEMAEKFGERALFGPRRTVGQPLKDVAEKLIKSVKQQSDAVAWAIRKETPDFVFTVWDHPDTAAHLFWHYSDLPVPDRDSLIFKVYDEVDRGIGTVLDAIGGDPLVIVCSDHGAYPIRYRMRLPLWLEQQGWFKLAHSSRYETLKKAESTWSKLPQMRKVVHKLVPLSTRRKVNRSLRPTTDDFVDWPNTSIYPQLGTAEAMYLNLTGREPDGVVAPEGAEELAHELSSKLGAVMTPDGTPAIATIVPRASAYSGDQSVFGPDLIAEPAQGTMLAPARLGEQELFWSPERPDFDNDPPRSVCYHDPDGMVIVAGGSATTRTPIRGHVEDIVPTVMRYLDLPMPRQLDGRALEGAFEALPAERWLDVDVSVPTALDNTGLTEAEAADIDRHLQELGYIE